MHVKVLTAAFATVLLAGVLHCGGSSEDESTNTTNSGIETAFRKNPKLKQTLDRMHKEASGELFTRLKGWLRAIFRELKPEDMKDAYLAMDAEQGGMMYRLIVEHQAKNIVEFGTSFGVSTLYLAAGARETGGRVITTEILPEKVRVASANFEEAGMRDLIEIREGDAMKTLVDAPEGIEFLLLDGWKDLYVPLVKLLEPKLKDGCIIVTDNVDFPSVKPYIEYIRSSPRYRRLPVEDDATDVSVYSR